VGWNIVPVLSQMLYLRYFSEVIETMGNSPLNILSTKGILVDEFVSKAFSSLHQGTFSAQFSIRMY
jgi:hypothetical protein